MLRFVLMLTVLATVIVAIGLASWRIRGDFYATLPGGYAERLNPTLWNSPDLRESWAFHQNTYFHGPIQYLTLYPIVFLDSYEQIARVLLPVYVMVLALALRAVVASVGLLTGRDLLWPVLASSCLFVPLLQAFVQREFETVVLLPLALALRCLLQDRRDRAAAWLAYVAWFKYLPLAFVGYLGLRRWGRALAVFAATSLAIVLLAHFAFGIQNFFNNNVPGTAAHVLTMSTSGFCAGWTSDNETLANVRQGLCRMQSLTSLRIARNSYLLICGLVALSYLLAHVRLSRLALAAADERWRRALEFSIVTTLYACFFFGHYYYLSALVIPMSVLLARYLSTSDRRGAAGWGLAYLLLSGAVLPSAVLGWVRHETALRAYMQHAVYLYGELLLMALLLREYWRLASRNDAVHAHSPQASFAHA